MRLSRVQVIVGLVLAATAAVGRSHADEPTAKAAEGVKAPDAGSVKPEDAKPATAAAPPTGAAPQPEAVTDKASEPAGAKPEASGDKPKGDSAKAEATAEKKAEAPADDASKLTIELHPGAYIYYYQPFLAGTKNFMELYFAFVTVDASVGDYGLHVQANIRDKKLYDYSDSNVWIEEGYAFYKHKYVTAKVGKVYTRFGRFWDNSFWGNIHFFEGMKFDADYGISGEGSVGEGPGMHLGYALQYFLVDGRFSYAFPFRDTVSTPDSRQRHSVVAHVEPAYFFNDTTSLTLGVSGQYFQADLAKAGKQNVFRVGPELTFTLGPWSLWGEYMRQEGQSVTDWPIPTVPATMTTMEIPGESSKHNNYVLVGTEVKWWKLAARYNWSFVDYHDLDIIEWMGVAGVGMDVHPNVNIGVEHIYMRRAEPTASILLDHAIDVNIYAHF